MSQRARLAVARSVLETLAFVLAACWFGWRGAIVTFLIMFVSALKWQENA